ncbi:MAG: hypothetical protein JW829_08305, partial [Pirellulales bacterium]|nr:hypothetical protein [Pirellulales bacterium]
RRLRKIPSALIGPNPAGYSIFGGYLLETGILETGLARHAHPPFDKTDGWPWMGHTKQFPGKGGVIMARTNFLWFCTWGAIGFAIWFVAPAAWGGTFDKIRNMQDSGRILIQERNPAMQVVDRMEFLGPAGSGSSSSAGGGSAGSESGGNDPSWAEVTGAIHDMAGAVHDINGILGGRGSGHRGRPNRGGGGGWYPVPMPTPGDYFPSSGTYLPSTSSSSSILVPGNALPSAALSNGSSVVSGRGLTIINPVSTGGSVRFRIGGRTMELKNGYQQVVRGGGQRVIEFDRGGDFGLARYTLTDGTFQFKVTERGWDIVKKVFRVTIDNQAGQGDFRYVIDNRPMLIAAGQVQKHQGGFPFVVKFDNGSGGSPIEMVLKSGTYRIGIHPETGLWDFMKDETMGRLASNPLPEEAASELADPLANPLP